MMKPRWVLILNKHAPPTDVHLIGFCTDCQMFAIMFEDGGVARTHQKYLSWR